MVLFWSIFVFVVGAIIGSFLNVAIARLPLEKSLLWPSSRCGVCQQAIRWYDNIPLLSYWLLRGRCRACGAVYSMQYFWVELATGLGFLGLYYLEVVGNIHGWRVSVEDARLGGFAWPLWGGFAFHALLFSLLLAASVCDLNGREIPLSLTMPGTVMGLLGAVLMPWPWPESPSTALPRPLAGMNPDWVWRVADARIGQGVYAWPVWGPLPSFLEPGGNWQTGLATGLAGAFVGTFMMRAIRFAFSRGIGKEALGLGDADLMMMAGAFLGWQMMPVALFLSIPFALVVGLLNIVLRRDSSLPFGPSLAGGLLLTMLSWRWIAQFEQARLFFFWGKFLLALTVAAIVFLFVAGFVIRMLRGSEGGES
jgi:leader peptidase (prepilin peptidase)/N-methyltransferase